MRSTPNSGFWSFKNRIYFVILQLTDKIVYYGARFEIYRRQQSNKIEFFVVAVVEKKFPDAL